MTNPAERIAFYQNRRANIRTLLSGTIITPQTSDWALEKLACELARWVSDGAAIRVEANALPPGGPPTFVGQITSTLLTSP